MKTQCPNCGEELGKDLAVEGLCDQCGEEFDVPDGNSSEEDDSESANILERECPECFTESSEFRKDKKCPYCGYEKEAAEDY